LKIPQLILASQSPRRKILLKQIGLKFRVHPSNIQEDIDRNTSPTDNARRIALQKAVEVASLYEYAIIVGADTIVVLGNEILGKPASASDAKRMLTLLSGRQHIVITAIAIVDSQSRRHVVLVEKTMVKFRKIQKDEIERYVASGSPMDKAGAYGIQDDYGAVFVERLNGCFYNVVGFPLSRFHSAYCEFLRELEYQ
jgi:septum formation protein